jgi:alpha-D-ribose 1-methylphosphonate 5-triphosphate synthase subunit PhnH
MNNIRQDQGSQSEQFKLATIWQADTQNEIFQSLMQAMSRPGTVMSIEDKLDGAELATAILATLSDSQVTASNCDELISDWDWSLSQCRSCSSELADYIICDGSLVCSINPKLGSLPSPDQSATVILKVDLLGIDEPGKTDFRFQLSGPGIDGLLSLAVSGMHQSWIQQREEWNRQFPMGVDMLLTDKSSVLALPRTTQLEVVT